jgi:hypothetical protein
MLKNIAMRPAPSGRSIDTLSMLPCASAIDVAKIGQKTAAVGDQQPDARVEHAFDVRRPIDVDELIGVAALLLERDAVAQVHDEPLALAELADDFVARDRTAAFPVLDRDAFDAAERQRGGCAVPVPVAASALPRGGSAPARRRKRAACRARYRRGCRAGSWRRIPSAAPPSAPTRSIPVRP